MKLSAIVENDENMAMIPFFWLMPEERKEFIRDGYEVIPNSGYQETRGFRAFKIIGKYTENNNLIRYCSIPIWEDWKLTAKYASRIEKPDSTTGQQMFDHLNDDEKIKALTRMWFDPVEEYIKKYFKDHPDLLERAKNSLKLKDINNEFKNLLTKI